ncbi:hypothetical protein PVAP13_9KG146085 [Panicum virgatum]|uniref:Uncharacterized protein n=1 Tax=Panicum virgatum TaxID=38727 RepID=A0A8T0NIN5_PANVG|nr:hypothetical protein PVAP13_9KG146085 [Panicum virgatum]
MELRPHRRQPSAAPPPCPPTEKKEPQLASWFAAFPRSTWWTGGGQAYSGSAMDRR